MKFFFIFTAFLFSSFPTFASGVITLTSGKEALDMLPGLEIAHSSENGALNVKTAPDKEGVIRRIEVTTIRPGTTPFWGVASLHNPSDAPIERLLVAPHYKITHSGVFWVKTDQQRIINITPTQDAKLKRLKSANADVFKLTVPPGETITVILELTSSYLPELLLWDQETYRESVNDETLYYGILIGVCALVILFLSTLIFTSYRTAILFSALGLACSTLFYLGTDMGLFSELSSALPSETGIFRAMTEALFTFSLSAFLFTSLEFHHRYHPNHLTLVFFVLGSVLFGFFTLYDAPTTAGITRTTLASITFIGFILSVTLTLTGYRPAYLLLPTWALVSFWTLLGALIVTNYTESPLAPIVINSGATLTVLLTSFTAINTLLYPKGGSDRRPLKERYLIETERLSLAFAGANAFYFDWNVEADLLAISPEFEKEMGVKHGTFAAPMSEFLSFVHVTQYEFFRFHLENLVNNKEGRISHAFLFQARDGRLAWYWLCARPAVGRDKNVVRIIGALLDVTRQRNLEESLMKEGTHDLLTNLPNRVLFADRLSTLLRFQKYDASLKIAVLYIEIDKLNNLPPTDEILNAILVTLSRRVHELLGPTDILGKIEDDCFGAVVLFSKGESHVKILALADLIRTSVSAPFRFEKEELTVSATIGVVFIDKVSEQTAEQLILSAKLAAKHGEQSGGDRVQVYKEAYSKRALSPDVISREILRAVEDQEVIMLFQPIVDVMNRVVIGFDAHFVWEHPQLGRLFLTDLLPIIDDVADIHNLGVYFLREITEELACWRQFLTTTPPIFATLNLMDKRLLNQDFLPNARAVLNEVHVEKGALRLSVSDKIVMQNPLHAIESSRTLRMMGVDLTLEHFGESYFSLATLQSMRFTSIKIDRHFFLGSDVDARLTLTRLIVASAQQLKIQPIICGVETEEDASALLAAGCTYAQGPVFGPLKTRAQARRLISGDMAADEAQEEDDRGTRYS